MSLYINGKRLSDKDDLFRSKDVDSSNICLLRVSLPMPGGKGGFGSMLRAIGAQIEKTTNREACRDLSGRRLRDVNEEKRLKEWIKKQAEKKEEAEKKKKEKLKRLAEMTVPASCSYSDAEHEKTRAEIPDIVEDSIAYGMQQQKKLKAKEKEAKEKEAKEKELISKQETNTAGSSTGKRKADEIESEESAEGEQQSRDSVSAPTTSSVESSNTEISPKQTQPNESIEKPNKKPQIKKQALWLGVDIDSDDDSSSGDSDD